MINYKFLRNPILRKAEMDSAVRILKDEIGKLFDELDLIEKRLEAIEAVKGRKSGDTEVANPKHGHKTTVSK